MGPSPSDFTRYYVSSHSRNPDVDLYLRGRVWVNDFNTATLFGEVELSAVKNWLVENPVKAGMGVVVRSVTCQVNGYDAGTVLI